MKTVNPQSKILILSAVIGVLLIVPLCYDLISGFVLGITSTSPQTVLNEQGEALFPIYLEVEPRGEVPRVIASNQGDLPAQDVHSEVIVHVPMRAISPVVTIGNSVLSVIAIVIAIYFVVSLVKLAPIIPREGLLSARAVKQMRRVSYSMLLAYVLFAINSYLPTWYYTQVLQMQDYTICYPRVSESLVTAVILILLTEILSIARKLKEDQELTI